MESGQPKAEETMGLNCSPCPKYEVIGGQLFTSMESIARVQQQPKLYGL